MRLALCLGYVVSCFFITLLPDKTKAETAKEPQSKILKLLLKKTPKPNYGAPVPKLITGRVRLQSDQTAMGVKGVSISDGYSVVKTDVNGAYELTPNQSAVFINITRPSGYEIQGDWYKPLAPQVDFELKQTTDDENDYIFVHVTDTHVSTSPRSVEGLSEFVQEVNALSPKPRFVVNSGDLLNLHKALVSSPASGHASFRNYVGIMNHLTMPYYNVAGDHTDSSYRLKEFPRGDHRCAKPMYWEYLGPHFFSFEYGKIHFMSVDYGYHLGQIQNLVNGRKLEYPTLEVQPVHAEWMKQDMFHRSPGTFVVTTSEADLAKHCPGFLEMAQQNDVRLQLVGDDHVVANKRRPVPYRTGGALAGCWWNPKAKQLCPDLSPQGYLIYRVKGEQMDYFYKGLGQRIAIVSHRVGAPWTGRVELQAHLVQPQPNETLEYSVNGTDWKPMHKIGQPFYRALFVANINSTSLPEGHLQFDVRSTATREVRSRKFVVANNSGPLESQNDALLEFSVGKANSNAKNRKVNSGKVEVLFNNKIVGELTPNLVKDYVFPIKASNLGVANTLSFRFLETGDAMSLGSPVLKFQGKVFRDPRDEAIRRVRTGHWGASSADWGGFLAGNPDSLDETPFQRQQNRFCFVLNDTE
ncbi:metallophosphoesterase N-terminal domain-containing protein [Gimesia aquarii]|uniref:Calcineurin-like phosphoesterase N-terminal domain-containing protein n=1 Tax=Gimesia aquarii TaxID=2527964 RepID=A0A517VT63_9PLAN|nr:metallophosphoesterase N-terminal domain-containing protein [Gimesia aquarii]QDT96198.1 hypothetical protein V144x_16510 [Gimesia aquarii]